MVAAATMIPPSVQTEAVLAFLADRIAGDAGRGRSSDAMIAAAVRGKPVGTHDYPSDLGDLGRCCDAFLRAPYELREAMLRTLADFAHALDVKARP